jgi:hypothetical protein
LNVNFNLHILPINCNSVKVGSNAGGLSIHFFADDATVVELKRLNVQQPSPSVATYTSFNKWEDFLILSRELKLNDFFVIVSSRNGHSSYISQLEKLPYYLSRYFLNNSFIIIYPKQTPSGLPENEKENADNSILDTLAEKVQVVNKAGNYISNIFRRKK